MINSSVRVVISWSRRLCSERAMFTFLLIYSIFILFLLYRDDTGLVTKGNDVLMGGSAAFWKANLSTRLNQKEWKTKKEYEDVTGLDKKQLLINTTNCKIPDLLPWSESTPLLEKKCTKYFLGDPKCEENEQYSWTYVNGSYLFVNMTAVVESGYSQNSIRCCYRVISRVEQSLSKYDIMADRRIRYSKECYPVTLPKQLIKEEFIRVFCMSTSVPLINDVVSRDFFAIAQPDTAASQKISKWKQFRDMNPDGDIPPNVIILGLDTMSRLSSFRNLIQTLDFLEAMGAIEIEGYTKVGATTYPNTVAFLSGYDLSKLTEFCYKYIRLPQDYCPYLWKAFDKLDYLTTTMDDTPLGTTFNFLKGGFINKPTDFYLRPMMLAVMKHQLRENNWYLRCLGTRMIEEVILNYLSDILQRASSGAPVFAHVWLAVMAHECSLSAKYVDRHLHRFLQQVDKQNTVIMFMGDHGDVYGPFRETVQGWYEDKLPTLWVYLPPRLRSRFPEWLNSLHINSKRLTSPFDMYKTLVHILKTFDPKRKAKGTYSRTRLQTGQSLFEPVPENRSCNDAGIPAGYCACSQPQSMNVKNPTLVKAANIALEYVIKTLPEQCAVPTMKEIVDAKYFVTEEDYKVYIITFVTDPGHFIFEGTVKQVENEEAVGNDEERRLVVANDVLRMNKISRKANCISDPLLEKYCYCK